MAVTQIVGPRLKPLWADPVEWTSTRAYEPFTFVTYQGDSWCSRQDTPIGIDITNDDYWVKVSDYNAQAVALQREMTNTIEAAESSMESTIQTAENTMTSVINTAESDMAAQVSAVESVKEDFQDSLDAVKLVTPFDTEPKQNSTKGVTSGGLYTLNSNITTLINQNADDVVICGDSWSEDYSVRGTDTWAYYYAQRTKRNVHNYSRGGATIIGTTPNYALNGNILGEINAAINDTSYDHNRVSVFIIEGGINDFRSGHSGSEVSVALTSHITRVRSNFPHARICVVLNYQVFVTTELYNFVQNICTNVQGAQAEVYNLMACIAFPANFNTDDYVHPIRPAGALQLLQVMTAIIEGGAPVYQSWNDNVIRITNYDNTGIGLILNTSSFFESNLRVQNTCDGYLYVNDISTVDRTTAHDYNFFFDVDREGNITADVDIEGTATISDPCAAIAGYFYNLQPPQNYNASVHAWGSITVPSDSILPNGQGTKLHFGFQVHTDANLGQYQLVNRFYGNAAIQNKYRLN